MTPDEHFKLGNEFRNRGQLDRAADEYRLCLQDHPDNVLAMNNLATVLAAIGKFPESIEVLRSLVALQPDHAVAWQNLGSILLALKRLDESHDALANAIRLDANSIPALLALANLYKEIGEVDRAIECDRRAISLRPELSTPADDLCYCIQYSPSYDANAIQRLLAGWNARYAEPLKPLIRPHTNDRDPDRSLRVGYVSPNFRDHCQSLFMIPLLSHHDPRTVEVFCYSDADRPDAMTERISRLVPQWRSIVGGTDQQVAQLIRSERIDILVDLSMHMTSNRLRVLAQKPAPVQITWLAYPGSTGMSAIDYRLTDPFLDPPGIDESIYAEKTNRLPQTFWCYDALADGLPVNPLPALTQREFTFGCLNHFLKVNEGVLQLWSLVLREVPDSRMMILCDPGRHRDRVIETMQIDPARIVFVERRPRRQYLELYHQIDLCLDTFPYNGHTTSLDAMWMGVPTVNLIGDTIVGRAGLSQLSNVGMTDLAAKDADEFVRIAIEWSRDRARLAAVRAGLRDLMRASPLCDAASFARNIEGAYRALWRRWCET